MRHTSKILFILILFVLSACAGQGGLGNIASQLGGTQVGALLSAGERLVKAAQPLTPEQEYYLGRGVSAMVFSRYKPLKNNSLNQYLNKVGRTLAGFSDKPETFAGYHFIALDTNEVNALSAPGGFVFVSRGLIKLMPNEDALASVLAHEIGHTALNHGVNAISQANLTEALTIVGKEAASTYGSGVTQTLTATFGDSVKDVVDTQITDGYSRGQEYDADEYAAALLKASGYPQDGLLAMLNTLKTYESGQSGGWFSTHPEPDDRIDNIEDEIKPGQGVSKTQVVRDNRFRQAVKGIS